MKNTLENKKLAIQYLYGELSEGKLDEFEEGLFTDENASLFLDEVEDDLIDEYIRGELEFEEKQKFEKNYLTTDSRHEKVAIARTLHKELFVNKENPISSISEDTTILQSIKDFFRMPNLALAGGLAVLLLMILFGGYWIFDKSNNSSKIVATDNSNQQNNILQKQEIPVEEITPIPDETPENKIGANNKDTSESNKTLPDKANKPSIKEKKSKNTKKKTDSKPVQKKPKVNKKTQSVKPKPNTFIATLLPPLRSSQTPVLNIPKTAMNVRLKLFDNFGEVYEKFVVELNDASGNTIWSRQIFASKKRPQKSITINIPGNQFTSGNYEIAVKGITKEGSFEEVNFYNFVVNSK